MSKLTNWILAISLMLPSIALAQEVVRVNSMNYPAWVERGDRIVALRPGSSLQSNDLVQTGDGGRVLLQFSDGSAVKLGESARFKIESASENSDQSLLQATFDVLQGAFRFTSSFFQTATMGHQVDVRIGAVTAGVRGTDIWGRSNLEKDLVCLIEGAIEVSSDGQAPVTMSEPLDFYVKPKGEPALPVSKVDEAQLMKWGQETELQETSGIATEDGDWLLVVSSMSDASYVDDAVERWHRLGYGVEDYPVLIEDRRWYRLALSGFASAEAARAAGRQLESLQGVSGAWVWQGDS